MMKNWFCVVYIFHISVCLASAQTTDNELIRVLSTGSLLKGAKIIVNDNSTIHLYLGIPYAESPADQNRYKAPIKRAKWDGILDASYYKVSCLYDSPDFEVTLSTRFMSEDCLHVSVISSESCIQNGRCPVAVYLHGSNFNYASSSVIPVEDIARRWATNDIIVVTTNFRLGSFGFLNLGEKTTAVNNAGLLDQLEALRWVQREISRFGGDARRVTLMGFGSGAINADLLAISPTARGLFQQVVIIGGAAGTMPNINEDWNVAASRSLAIESGCTTRFTWDTTNKEDIVNCLRGRQASELLSVQRMLENTSRLYAFNLPAVDAREATPIIPNSVSTLSKMRRGYTMMIGSISNSMNWPNNAIKLDLFVPTRKMLKAMCGVAMLHRHFNFTVKLVKACQREYSTVSLGSKLVEDVAVFLPIYDSASANTRNGGTTFLFDYLSDDKEESLLAFAPSNSANITQSDYVGTAISLFIKTGDPSSEALKWQPFEEERNNFVALTAAALPMNVNEYHFEAVNFWTIMAPQIAEKAEWLKENGTNILNDLVEAGKEGIASFAEAIGSIRDKRRKAIIEAIGKIASALGSIEEEIAKQKEAAVSKGIGWIQGHIIVADILVEVNNLLDGVLADVCEKSVDSAVMTTAKSGEEGMNSIEPALRASIVGSVARSAVSNGDAEMVTIETADDYWGTWTNGAWFWIIHAAAVVIVVALVAALATNCCSRKSGRSYEILA
uniref:Carboxylesterase 2 n=1 Tax=Ascaris suum TaxID=6253 RepID=F1KY57_ASCSU